MREKNASRSEPHTVSIARQPIFDGNRRLWGYALACVGRQLSWTSTPEPPADLAVQLASSAYIGLQQILDRNQRVLIDFSEKNILDHLPYALPPQLSAVQITEAIFQRPDASETLQQLKKDGYLVALTGFTNQPDCTPLYRLADIISVDVRQKSRDRLAATLDDARSHGGTMLCMHVEDTARFAVCSDLGFDLFHGPFFKRPDAITVRTLSSNEVARFKLMKTIEKAEVDFEQLAETIQSDPALSFRLLAYLNSAAFGLRQKIQSIHQAISLLGWRKMKNWLRVVLLNDVNRGPDAPELMVLASQRGKFMEKIAEAYDYWGFDPESLHMLGIFSLLDVMLGAPMQEITGYLPLDQKLKSALCRESNNEYVPLLDLAQAIEEGDWVRARQMVDQLNMDEAVVREAFQKALDWAEEMVGLHNPAENRTES
ncbi:MAG: HDOD domain-containing protein [Desulfatitalea sp.]|nr:HDOD domain-containing protein [Desulfatitalea sp.]NNJ99681.1 HDOD domain-containing protein [Desulfatitalea sp.]